jgi:transcriptional regulator
MYIPASFREDDPDELRALMRAHSFGTLVSVLDGAPFATHLPFLVDGEGDGPTVLRAHLARANPQWRAWEHGGEGEVLAIFTGPHAYVSPTWYAEPGPAVPTWNYTAVHAYGEPRLMSDDELRRSLADMVAVYEAGRDPVYSMDTLPEEFVAARVGHGTVGIEIAVTRLEGKAKLSQNRPDADRRSVIAALRAQSTPDAHATAAAMERALS